MLIRMVLVVDGGVLGENGDAALALQVVGVHGAFGHALVGAEDAGLLEEASTSVVLPWSTWAMMATLRIQAARLRRAVGLAQPGLARWDSRERVCASLGLGGCARSLGSQRAK
jgi:hypothetical protein